MVGRRGLGRKRGKQFNKSPALLVLLHQTRHRLKVGVACGPIGVQRRLVYLIAVGKDGRQELSLRGEVVQ